MFIIVPKRNERQAQLSSNNEHAVPSGDNQTHTDGLHESDLRGQARTQTACDSCRLRKAKCSGQRPCDRCREKKIICVYARSNKQELPVSARSITLLQNQQTRLETAMKQMAAVIARLELKEERAADSFDIVDLIEKYAPQEYIDTESESAVPRKRRLVEMMTASSAADQNMAEDDEMVDVHENPDELSLAQLDNAASYDQRDFSNSSSGQQVVDTAQAGSGINGADFQAMLQYMQMIQDGTAQPTADLSVPGAGQFAEPQTDPTSAMSRPGNTDAAPVGMDGSTLDLFKLVDWGASLDFCSDYLSSEDQNFDLVRENAYDGI